MGILIGGLAIACVLLGFDADSGQARVLLPETGQGSVNLTRDDLAGRYTGEIGRAHV